MSKARLRLLIMIFGAVALSQIQGQAQALEKGELEYRSRCAVCHGIDAKGKGPFISQLQTAPPDLTQLAKQNGGTFPEEIVNETIDGRKDVGARGPRDMPLWGYRYYAQKTRLQALVGYLRRIQEK